MDKNLLMSLNSKKFGLDVRGGELNYISHAHTDHSYALAQSTPIFCSDVTASLLDLNGCANTVKDTKDQDMYSSIGSSNLSNFSNKSSFNTSLNPIKKSKRRAKAQPVRVQTPKEFKLQNAGHVLGSTQLYSDTCEFGRFVYTGDFKLRDGLTTKGASIIDCDTLVIECTYGNPNVKFDAPAKVYDQMYAWHKRNKSSIQLWGGYSVGKAQEIIKFLNDYADQIPIVSKKIAHFSQKYVKNSMNLKFISSDSLEAKEIMRDGFCAVFSPNELTRNFSWQIAQAHKRKTAVAFATGWTGIRRMHSDVSFGLSDHADFHEILTYAQESGAKQVFTAHGDNLACAKALEKHGINAHELSHIHSL